MFWNKTHNVNILQVGPIAVVKCCKWSHGAPITGLIWVTGVITLFITPLITGRGPTLYAVQTIFYRSFTQKKGARNPISKCTSRKSIDVSGAAILMCSSKGWWYLDDRKQTS